MIGQMMFQNAVPKVANTNAGRSSGRFIKLGLVALMLLGGVGAVGFVYRHHIKEALGYVTQSQPATTPVVETAPGQESLPQTVVVPEPPSPTVTKTQPDPTPTRSVPPDSPPPRTPPVSEPPRTEPQPVKTAPVVPVKKADVAQTKEAPPPRALPVDPPTLTKTDPASPPKAVPVDDEPPAMTPPPKPEPQGVQTTRTPQMPELASNTTPTTPQGSLVEIGRAKPDPKTLPDPRSSLSNGERPIIKDVPPKCRAAVDGLKSFLAAPTWRERLQFMQLPDQMARKAEIYYSTNADGPVEVDEIHYLRHDEDPQVGRGMQVIFVLFSRLWDYGFPVMVEDVSGEARVDWLTFVEFKDDLLNKFLGNYMEGPVRFHVGIRRTHYFEDDVPNHDEMDAFEVTTPMENTHGFVFTPKSAALARSLNSTLSWDKEASWVIVELQWRRQGSAKWIELTGVPQLNWYSDSGGSASEKATAPPAPGAKAGAK